MEDGTESKTISPGGAEVCDLHTFVTLRYLLAPL